MNLETSPEQAELRARLAEWLETNRPADLPDDFAARFEALRDWQRRLYDGGWLGYGWSSQFGGRDGTVLDQIVINQELVRAKAPSPVGLIGLEVVGPTIAAHGSDDQRKRLLPALLRGDEIWCQGFSEPDAGSDLASLRTSAHADGHEFVVSGQKVWTSWAQFADWCAVLARTDPAAPKHRGISYLLVDMHLPGISVHPLVQMTGDAEFNEVFFDEVRVPGDALLGDLHDGWHLTMTTLSFERGPYTLRRQAELAVALRDLIEQAGAATGDAVLADPIARSRLGEAAVLIDVLEAQGYRVAERILAGDHGPDSSVEKLLVSHVEQTVYSAALDLLGPFKLIEDESGPFDNRRWLHDYLYSRAASIYGGTAEIQRGIIAERVLGLPKGADRP